jgi:phenylpyruvate tautomerase PptA (4-oxalocrotonate tautomerase family)
MYAASFDGAGITVVTVTLLGKREEEVAVMLDWP